MGLFTKQAEVKKHYDMGDLLGTGNFAEVHKGKLKAKRTWQNPSGSGVDIPEAVAIKVIDKSKVEDMNDIQREIEIMQLWVDSSSSLSNGRRQTTPVGAAATKAM